MIATSHFSYHSQIIFLRQFPVLLFQALLLVFGLVIFVSLKRSCSLKNPSIENFFDFPIWGQKINSIRKSVSNEDTTELAHVSFFFHFPFFSLNLLENFRLILDQKSLDIFALLRVNLRYIKSTRKSLSCLYLKSCKS